MSIKRQIWDYLLSWLGNEYGVAGLMGNIRAESNYRPTNLQNRYEQSLGMSDDEYTQKVDAGTYANFVYDSAGYGLVQWTFWSRKKALLDYARKEGASIGDLAMQLDFLKLEFTQSYPTVVSSLKSAKSIRDASNVVLFVYERPADQSAAMQDLRTRYGEEAYAEFHGTGSGITADKFLAGCVRTAETAQVSGWTYGNSTSMPPGADGYISCDRLVSRTLYVEFGVTDQKRGGWNSAELAVHLPELGFTKTTSKADIRPGTVVMVGKGDDLTYHTFVVERYDPATDLCDKIDLGHKDRIKAGGRFKNVLLCEWPERRFTYAFVAPEGGTKPAEKTYYRVQCGAFNHHPYAVELRNRLRNAGFDTFVKDYGEGVDCRYRVQIGAFEVKSNAEKQKQKAVSAGFNAIIV